MNPNRDGPTWKPRPEDYGQIFSEQNPWHVDGKVPNALARRIERPLAKALWRRLLHDHPRRYQLIIGPRRVGKTTCLYQTVRSLLTHDIDSRRLWWLRLDHPLLMEIRLGDLVRYICDKCKAETNRPAFLFLDELTYADHWDHWLKTFYDEQWPIRIAGSSSATTVLRDRRNESGVGRWDEQYLAPYHFSEYLSLIERPVQVPIAGSLAETLEQSARNTSLGIQNLDATRRRFILTGGFPELLIDMNTEDVDEESALLESQRRLRNDAVERAILQGHPTGSRRR